MAFLTVKADQSYVDLLGSRTTFKPDSVASTGLPNFSGLPNYISLSEVCHGDLHSLEDSRDAFSLAFWEKALQRRCDDLILWTCVGLGYGFTFVGFASRAILPFPSLQLHAQMISYSFERGLR